MQNSKIKTTSQKSKVLKQSPIKAIFFDLGGVIVWGPRSTIVETLVSFLPISRKRIEKFYGPRMSELLHKGAETSISLTRKACKCFGIRPPTAREVALQFSAKYERYKKVSWPVLKLAKKLRRDYCVGLISDTIAEHVAINSGRGIFNFFKPVVLSNRVGLCKPGGAIFRYALRKARVRPHEAVFIDDLSENVHGAQRIGIQAIHFKSVLQLKRDLKKLGVAWS